MHGRFFDNSLVSDSERELCGEVPEHTALFSFCAKKNPTKLEHERTRFACLKQNFLLFTNATVTKFSPSLQEPPHTIRVSKDGTQE